MVCGIDSRRRWNGSTANSNGRIFVLIGGAAVYVGPDTSMTHLATATGCVTVALYGPASSRVIGPWPVGGLNSPWARAGTIQMVQTPLPRLPCEKLGCEGHHASHSQCLDEQRARQVLAALDQALAACRTVAHKQVLSA
jgi:heptosyltransferase-3